MDKEIDTNAKLRKKRGERMNISDEERQKRRDRMIELRKKLNLVTKNSETTIKKASQVKAKDEVKKKPRTSKKTLQPVVEEIEEKKEITSEEEDDDIENLENEVQEAKKNNEKRKLKKKPVTISSDEEESDYESDDLDEEPAKKKKSKPITIPAKNKPPVRKVFKIKYYGKPTPDELLQDRLFLENQHKDDNDHKIKKNLWKNKTEDKGDDLSNKLFNY